MYPRFGLTLMLNHACNLRCTYCYTGRKFNQRMPREFGERGIERAVASIEKGGRLELGFFGGEPLIEAPLVLSLIDFARITARSRDLRLSFGLTTNGTITSDAAWTVMLREDVELFVSFDGLPQVHDRHRLNVMGESSSASVLATMRKLLACGKDFGVVMVVRPDTLDRLAEGIRFLRALGVRRVEPSLDLWTHWEPADVERLERVVEQCATIWREGLPVFGIGWFDEKAAAMSGAAMEESARCSFGDGEIAVAPSGNLYPCERLIGEDDNANAMRLPGHVAQGNDFLESVDSPQRDDDACRVCPMQSMCSTTCRCSNFVRSGSVSHPDGLLCAWNEACAEQTARVLLELSPAEISAGASL